MTKTTTLKEVLTSVGKVLVVYASVGAIVVGSIERIKKLCELIDA